MRASDVFDSEAFGALEATACVLVFVAIVFALAGGFFWLVVHIPWWASVLLVLYGAMYLLVKACV